MGPINAIMICFGIGALLMFASALGLIVMDERENGENTFQIALAKVMAVVAIICMVAWMSYMYGQAYVYPNPYARG